MDNRYNASHQLNLIIESYLMEREESWYGQVDTMVMDKTNFCGQYPSLPYGKKVDDMHNYCFYSKVKPPWHLYFMSKGQASNAGEIQLRFWGSLQDDVH